MKITLTLELDSQYKYTAEEIEEDLRRNKNQINGFEHRYKIVSVDIDEED